MSYFKRRKIASKVEIERPEFVQGLTLCTAKVSGRRCGRWCFVADERWPCAPCIPRGNKPGPLNPRDFFVFKPVSRPARFTGDGYVGANAGNSANRAVSTSNYKLTTTTTATFFHASLDIDFAIEIYRNRSSGYFHLESAGPGDEKKFFSPEIREEEGEKDR